MQPLGHNSHPKDLKCEVPRTTLDVLEATWARPAVQNSSSLRFHSFKGRFWGDFRLGFRHIWVRFHSNLSYHLWSLIGIPKTLLVEVFPRSFFIFHANSWYSIQAYWYSIKGEVSRQVSRYSTKVFWYSASPTYPISPTYPMYPTCLTYPTCPTFPTNPTYPT